MNRKGNRKTLVTAGIVLAIALLAVSLFVLGTDHQGENVGETSENAETPKDSEITANFEPTEVPTSPNTSTPTALDIMNRYNANLRPSATDDSYRTTYEVFVYSFCDSDGDRIGDLQGLISKLDYINDGNDDTSDDLGMTAIWLMPIMPSTTYHKYDVVDYCAIDPQYGTLDDFKELVEEAHKRGVAIYIDFVMNHTSAKHEWFEKACQGDEKYRNYYHFQKEKATGYAKAPGTGGDDAWYYECRFWDQMPDLNLNNPDVRQEFERITDFWLELGVDGFRLDAVKEYESDQKEVNVEILKWFADYVKSKKEDAYIVGECWTGADTYDAYVESGIDSTFAFAFSQAEGYIAKAVNQGNAPMYAKHLQESIDGPRSYNENAIPAPFYTNHDNARSAGYYTGENDLAKTKMGWALSLTMTGNSFLYYGEELGMGGSGDDENKRQAFRWSADENTEGMATALKAKKTIKNKYGSLEEQEKDGDSLYHFVKQVLKIRNASEVIRHGDYTYLEDVSGKEYCVIQKDFQGKRQYLVYNLAVGSQTLDLTEVCKDAKVFGIATALQEDIAWENGELVLPGYTLVVLE